MCHSIAEVLNQVLAEGRHSAHDLAQAANCSVYTIYRVRNDESDLSATRFLLLSRYLSEHGDNRLARLALSARYEICPAGKALANGRIDDEMRDLVQIAGHVVDAYLDRRTDQLDVLIEQLYHIIDRIRAEKARLKP